jgi:general secretion pathway protein D
MLLALAGCNTSPTKDSFADLVDGLHARNSPLRSGNNASRRVTSSHETMAGFAGAEHLGTGSFVSRPGPAVARARTSSGGEGYELNLVNAPIAEAAKAVLGDALGVSYVVDPRVQGTVTLQTSSPVSREALSDILESALAVNGAGIVQQAGSYRVVPIGEVLASTPSVGVGSNKLSGPGIKVQVFELQHVAADEMRTILEPISRQGSILRTDSTRNLIVIAGNSGDLNAMQEAISVFDVDWMKGMSVAIHPLKTSQPAAVADELNTIFETNNGPGAKLIRFVPNERLNAILVISSRPAYLTRAATWIAKLDKIAQTNDDQLFVYEIQNRPAKELADVLKSVLSSGSMGASSGGPASVSPDLSPVMVSADGSVDPSLTDRMGIEPASAATAFAAGGANLSVTADVENNALLIQTTARDYERIERILAQLDVLPTQVLIEAVIAEVTLSDELKFGLRWFFESGDFSLSLTDVASGFTGAAFPGFAWSYATDNIQVTLNALSSVTDVKVVSAPTLMALNNQKATLQIGDEVPIVTQQSVGTGSSDAPIVNSIEMKDTGVILNVIPRVNNAGRVMLEIEQEVSSVVKTTTSGIDSPTIQQRKISTKVMVNDGESLALGGLIQENNSLSRGQVPILGDIPIIGNVFKNKTDGIKRTELIIFIRPRVVRDVHEARDVTEEFRQQLNFETPITKRRGGATRTKQDLKRLAY